MDIFSTAYPDPLRVEFLGETVESLRLFDPATQKSTAKLDRAVVLPAREYLRSEDCAGCPCADSAGCGVARAGSLSANGNPLRLLCRAAYLASSTSQPR